MKGIIMAGGEGSRLRPLTCNLPKPMVPILNKPIMTYSIELLKNYGITDIGVTLQYMPEVIRDYFDDGSNFGVMLNYFIEETPLGTAGSIKNAENFLDETFIVISGDALTNINLESAIKFHNQRKSIATLVLKRVEVPLEYGVVVTEKSGHIDRFLEKPNWGEVFSDTVNTGIYILEPEVLSYFESGVKFDFSKDLFPLLMDKKRPMYGYITDEYWCDIGNTQTYLASHFDLLSESTLAPFSVLPDNNNIFYGKGVVIDKDAVIEGPCYIGDYSKIDKNTYIGPYSVIGINCKIAEGASIKRSVLWDRVMLGNSVEIRGAIICNNVDIKSRTAIYEGVVIGDNTQIREDCIINPSIKIWPCKTIEEKNIINNNIIWGTKSSRYLFGKDGIHGTVNAEITPQTASRIGAAYGAYLKPGKKVGVSSDGKQASIMVKHSMISGLLSAGQEVYDAGQLTTPILRFTIKELALNGGIHIFSLPNMPDECKIHMLDENGGNIIASVERKIENLYIRDDYIRQASEDIKRVHTLSDIPMFYIRSILSSLDTYIIREKRLKIHLYSPNRICSYVLNKVLEQAGCQITLCTDNMEDSMKSGNYDLGCSIDAACESFVIYDESGSKIEKNNLQTIISLIYLKDKPGDSMVIPYTASSVIEDLAKLYNCNVKRAKTERSNIMKQTIKLDEGKNKAKLFPLYFDAVYALIKLVELLSKEDISLSKLNQDIPVIYLKERAVYCPWSAKGKVMRTIIEEESEKDRDVELFEGIKINHENGWALILPDIEEPICRVYSEGLKEEYAEELAALYEKRINELNKNQHS